MRWGSVLMIEYIFLCVNSPFNYFSLQGIPLWLQICHLFIINSAVFMRSFINELVIAWYTLQYYGTCRQNTRLQGEREREWEQTQCIRAIEMRGSSSGRLHSHQPAMRQSGGMQQHCLRHSWNRALFVCGLMSPLRLIDVLLKAWMSHVFSRPGGHVTQLGAAVRRVVWCIGSAGVL